MREVNASTPAIVGTGVVSPLGFGVVPTLEALLAGTCAVQVQPDAEAGTGLHLAATVEEPYLRMEVPRPLEPQLKLLNGAGLMAVEASEEAWAHTGWAENEIAPERKGLWLSQMDAWDWTCIELRAGYDDATEHFQHAAEGEVLNRAIARRTKPYFILQSIKNNAFSFLANLHDLKGANTAVAGWSGATLGIVDSAGRALRRGDLDRALVVGAGRSAHEVARIDALRHGLRTRGNDDRFRPFEAGGHGEVRGEAAGALALERAADAAQGGRQATAYLMGFGGVTGEVRKDVSVPTADTYADAVASALDDARVEAGELGFVVLPSYGLAEADAAILEGLASLDVLKDVPRVSWRGALGNAALGGEIVDLVLAVEALHRGTVPGTVGCSNPLDASVEISPFPCQQYAALVVTAGMHGDVTAVVIAKPSAQDCKADA